MNHVPDDALARLDALGRAALTRDAIRVRVGLRTDLRFHADYDGNGPVAVRFHHADDARPVVRDHGSWLATYVDGVDRRLAAWGFRTPDAYRRASDGPSDPDDPEIATDNRSWQTYTGTVRLPGE